MTPAQKRVLKYAERRPHGFTAGDFSRDMYGRVSAANIGKATRLCDLLMQRGLLRLDTDAGRWYRTAAAPSGAQETRDG